MNIGDSYVNSVGIEIGLENEYYKFYDEKLKKQLQSGAKKIIWNMKDSRKYEIKR